LENDMHSATKYLTGMSFAAALLALPAAAKTSADFVKAAASGGMMEVELGRYASQQAADPKVRAFGERMAADHGKANEELKTAAKSAGQSVPSAMDAKDRAKVDELKKLRGAAFDKAYMDAMVKDHEHDVDAFRAQAKADQSAVGRFAERTLPTLESHLAEAKSIHDGMKSTKTSHGGTKPAEPGGRMGQLSGPGTARP
jgi:putative membrane protein